MSAPLPLAPLTLPCIGTGAAPRPDYVTLTRGITGDHVELLAVVNGHLAPVPISMADAARAADWLIRATMQTGGGL